MLKQLSQLVLILNKAGQFLQYAQAVHAALSQLVAHLHGSGPSTTIAPAPAVVSPAPVVIATNSALPSASSPAPYVFPPAPPLETPPLDPGKINGLNVAQ